MSDFSPLVAHDIIGKPSRLQSVDQTYFPQQMDYSMSILYSERETTTIYFFFLLCLIIDYVEDIVKHFKCYSSRFVNRCRLTVTITAIYTGYPYPVDVQGYEVIEVDMYM